MDSYFKRYHKDSGWPPVCNPSSKHVEKDVKLEDFIPLRYSRVPGELAGSIQSRESSKSIGRDKGLDKDILGTFLKWSVGEREDETGRRAYPSAGQLYSNELFIAVKEVAHLQPGLYKYHANEHALTFVNGNNDVTDALVQESIEYNFCVIVAADLTYAVDQYGERGYRFCLLEAGHMVQNMQLVAVSLNKAIVPIGGFVDEYLNSSVLPGEADLSALYLVPVGRKVDDV